MPRSRPPRRQRAISERELVARLAADRYMYFKQANFVQRAALLAQWRRRKGQMIYT
jgi:hypothetical protein